MSAFDDITVEHFIRFEDIECLHQLFGNKDWIALLAQKCKEPPVDLLAGETY